MPIRSMDRSIRLMVVVFLVVTIPSSLMAAERSIFHSDGSWVPPSLIHSARLRAAKHARVTLSVSPPPPKSLPPKSSPSPPQRNPSPSPQPPPSPPTPPPRSPTPRSPPKDRSLPPSPLPPPPGTAPPKDSGASTSNKMRTGKDLSILFLVVAGVLQVGVVSFLFLLRRRKPEKGKDSNGRLVG